MLAPVIALLVLPSEVAVDLDDRATCTTTVAVAAAVEPRVPLQVPLHLAITVTASAVAIDVQLALDIAGTSTATRQLELVATDCVLLPRLVASIAERYVTALPHRDWAAFRRARRLRVIHPRERPPPFAPPPPVSVWLGADVGAGVADAAARIHADGHLGIGRPNALQGELMLGVAAVGSARIGDGRIDVLSAYSGAGLGWKFDLGAVSIHPRLMLAGGLHIGRGRNFDGASTKVIALLNGLADVALRIDGFHVAMGVIGTILNPSFIRASTGDTFDEPLVRFVVSAGFSMPVTTW